MSWSMAASGRKEQFIEQLKLYVPTTGADGKPDANGKQQDLVRKLVTAEVDVSSAKGANERDKVFQLSASGHADEAGHRSLSISFGYLIEP